jgi:hypothetical protein
MSNIPNPLNQLITSALPVTQPQTRRSGNFFEALSTAWQVALDRQADVIQQQSQIVSDGGDKLSDITKLTAEAAKLNFMSTSSNTSMSESSKALETVARKG